MATGSRIRAQIAVIPNTKCELCEENEISWKCFTCNEYLCHQCKKTHLKSKASQDHKITTIKGADKQGQQGPEEKMDQNCHLHPDENITMFCKNCDLPLCTDCIVAGSHKKHKILKINNVIDDKQQKLSTVVAELNQKLSIFEQMINSIRKIETDYSQGVAACINDVKSRNVQLQAILDKITNDVIVRLQETERTELAKLTRNEIMLESDINKLKEMINKCTDKQEVRETELIKFVKDVSQRLDQFKPCDPPDPLNPPVLLTKEVDVGTIESLFGDLDLHKPKNVEVISNFKIPNKDLVAAVSDNQAWIGKLGYRDFTMVTSMGKVIKTINTDFPVNDLVVTESGELLVTVCHGNKVKKLTSDDRFVDLYVDPVGYETRGITVTDNNNIIVCLYNHDRMEGKLAQLSSTGKSTYIFQHDTDGITPLFGNPGRVSSNRNGDLIVCQPTIGNLVVIDKTGNRRFTYTGQDKSLRESFDPHYALTDKYGHIIVSDSKNSVIHLMDKDGTFLQFILSIKNGLKSPYGLSIDKSGRLWVCDYGKSKIMIAEYV